MGKDSLEAAADAEKVGTQTRAVLKSTGAEAGLTAKQIGNLATEISRKSGLDDEAVQSGENLLLTFTNVRNEVGEGNDIFSQATGLMADMSVALGQDMKSSAIQLGKALNDPIKGVTALQRVGVSFTADQKEQIKTLVEHGETLKAQKLIVAELNKEFGGSAKAFGSTTAGQVAKLKTEFGNLQEQLGGALAPKLTEITVKAREFVQQMVDGKGKGGAFVDKLKAGFADAKAALKPLTDDLKKIWTDKDTDLGEKIGKSIESAAPFIADSLAKAFIAGAPRAASAFVNAFKNAGPWGQLLTVAFLAKKLGAFSAAGRLAATRFATSFAASSAVSSIGTKVANGLILSGAEAGTSFGTKFAAAAKTLIRGAGWAALGAFIWEKLTEDAGEDPAKLDEFVKGSKERIAKVKAEVDKLAKSLTGMPTPKVINLMVKNKDALGAVGISVSELRKYGKLKVAAQILASNADAKTKVAQINALMDEFYRPRSPVEIKVDVSQALANINSAEIAINRMLTLAQAAIQKAQEASTAAHRSVVGGGGGLLFGLENQLSTLQRARDALQASFEQQDALVERLKLKAQATRKLIDTTGLTGTKLSNAKEHNDAIRQARTELATLNKELARAKQLAQIDVKISGKEKAIQLRDALKGIRSELTDKMGAALDAFHDKWESTIGKDLDKANNKALEAFDAVTQRDLYSGASGIRLKLLQDEADERARIAEDASNQRALDEATAAGDEAAKGEARARIEETARQREITAVQAAAETERANYEKARAAERVALEERQAAERQAIYIAARDQQKAALKFELDAELAHLKQRQENYKTFAQNVTKILKKYGLSTILGVSAEAEAAINSAGGAASRAVSSPTINVDVAPAAFRFFLDGKEIDVRVEQAIDNRNRKTHGTAAAGVA